ncbi:hypothetical protein BCR15_05365 [Tessaracoccus lapidicaptus]|uniref:Uncharacterized protein n=1 Tax=Tessaracoccus lapidicaptus TaxID=1427523 RepID=A0A1C0AKS8_9ACTN|nr:MULTISPECIES: MGMT family protein [Tessaracoccus]AQX15962.1 hypothetical protein BKM78_08555 [Tessaracoccus sp. T2.5-30]OCL33263.1 hypothetical protein BCR15_05365 [Tessaracoccus lapidicaptus]VEP40441.1 Methylated-DNA--protein-cysteine methyltransferase [Tessaracoccus lapidicaptus]
MTDPLEVIERVLRAVEQVPHGHVVSYGDIAALVETSPRRVGAIMGEWGGEVAWWRVTSAAGRLPEPLVPLARKQWQREGIPVDGDHCVISRCRADLTRLAADYADAVEDLS